MSEPKCLNRDLERLNRFIGNIFSPAFIAGLFLTTKFTEEETQRPQRFLCELCVKTLCLCGSKNQRKNNQIKKERIAIQPAPKQKRLSHTNSSPNLLNPPKSTFRHVQTRNLLLISGVGIMHCSFLPNHL
jgi:hypothetical protein